MFKTPSGEKPDHLERLVIADVNRVFEVTNLKPRNLFFCLFFDFWFGLLVVSPLIIASFRGSWKNWDYVVVLISGGCGNVQSACCLVIGASLMISLCLSQIYLQHILTPNPNEDWKSPTQLAFFFGSRFFVFVSVCADTLVWKGMWELLDNLDSFEMTKTAMTNVVLVIVLALILMCTKSFNVCHCSTVGVGYYIDVNKSYMHISTALVTESSATFWYRLLDACLTVFLNLIAVCVYRSLWTLVGNVKEEYDISSLNAFLIAITLSFFAYGLQFPNLVIHSLQISDVFKYVSHEITLAVSLIADVTVFRTVWYLLDDAILNPIYADVHSATSKPVSSNSLYDIDDPVLCRKMEDSLKDALFWDVFTHFGCFVALVVLRVSSSITCGVKRESHRMTEGIMIPRFYLTYLLSTEDSNSVPKAEENTDSNSGPDSAPNSVPKAEENHPVFTKKAKMLNLKF